MTQIDINIDCEVYRDSRDDMWYVEYSPLRIKSKGYTEEEAIKEFKKSFSRVMKGFLHEYEVKHGKEK